MRSYKEWYAYIKKVRGNIDKSRILVGEYVGEAMDFVESETLIHSIRGFKALKFILKESKKLFGERNVYIQEEWAICPEFMREIIAQYMSADGGKERAVFVLRKAGITGDIMQYISPKKHFIDGKFSVETIDDGVIKYKISIRHIHQYPIGTILIPNYKMKGTVIRRVNYLSPINNEIELEFVTGKRIGKTEVLTISEIAKRFTKKDPYV